MWTKTLTTGAVAAVLALGGLAARAADDSADPKTHSLTDYRASQIIGLKVRNPSADEDLGSVDDLVVDFRDAHVRYAAMSFGGFLGIGDKLFAVPFNAMQFHHTDHGNYLLVNVPKEQLKAAPGFDKNAWPNFADPQWNTGVDTFYKPHVFQRTEVTANGTRRVVVDTPLATVEVQTPAAVTTTTTTTTTTTKFPTAHRVSKVFGMNVYNPEGKSIGEVNDLVIDVRTGRAKYAALSFGGLLGIGDKLFAVPVSALKYVNDDNGARFVLDVTRERLEQAPGFDKSNWPNFADPNWSASDKFFSIRTTTIR